MTQMQTYQDRIVRIKANHKNNANQNKTQKEPRNRRYEKMKKLEAEDPNQLCLNTRKRKAIVRRLETGGKIWVMKFCVRKNSER